MVIVETPPVTLIPFLAVIRPIESILVTSSYVKVPPTDTSPATVRLVPSKVKLLLSSINPPVPDITTLPDVNSLI